MYGQGSYPQFGQGAQTPPPNFPQHPVAPPLPPFQQGTASSQHPTVQQCPPSIPPHLGHSGLPLHQHVTSITLQQRPPVHVPASGVMSVGQSYLPRPAPQHVQGSTSMDRSYPMVQQNAQWNHNLHHIPPPVPPPLGPPARNPSRPEMFGHSISAGALPRLPSQGHTPPRCPILIPQQGNMQGNHLQPLPPPPPPPPPLTPPTSSLFTPVPFGPFAHTVSQETHVQAMGSMPPPPPPSSPPPLPPSPPPPISPLPSLETISSAPVVSVSASSCTSQSGPTSYKSSFQETVSSSVDKVVASAQVGDGPDGVPDHNRSTEGPSSVVGSHMKGDLLTMNNAKLDLPPPPPQPAKEEVLRKIEVLCQFIAKNGPDFEDMACRRESGNPEFNFLFGGEPGSEALVAHEYFEWMKKKSILEYKMQHEHDSSVLRSSNIDKNVSCSPPDSDMDMEDDITQLDEGLHPLEGLNSDTVLIRKGFDTLEQSMTSKNDIEYTLVKDSVSGSLALAGEGGGSKLFAYPHEFTYGNTLSKVDSSIKNSTGASECPSRNAENPSVHSVEDLNRFNALASAADIGSDELNDKSKIGSSPFRLLQDYASDDSSEDDDKPDLEDVSPLRDLPSTAANAPSLAGDSGFNLQTEPESNPLSGMMASRMSPESVMPGSHSTPLNALDSNIKSHQSTQEAKISIKITKTNHSVGNINGNQDSIYNAARPEAFQPKDASDGSLDAAPDSAKLESQKEDVKCKSHPKVDEFGRLVREGASDSDSDESYHAGKPGKRGRSRSRSRSPYERRRRKSPWRRRQRRSQSRSWSPRRQKSRSRSPTYRRGSESGGDKMRRSKGQLQECFDFLRGRCHRGASCRYMHHKSESDGARHWRNKRQQVEVPSISRAYISPEEIEGVPSERSAQECDTFGSNFGASKVGNMEREKVLVTVQDAGQSISDQDDKSLVAEMTKSEWPKEESLIMQGTQDIKEEILESTTSLPDNEKLVETVHQQQVDETSTSNSLQVQTSAFQNQMQVGEPQLKQISSTESYSGTSSINQSFSSQSLPLKEFTAPIICAVDLADHHFQLPPPPPPPLPLLAHAPGTNTLGSHQLQEHNLMLPSSKLSSCSPAMENHPPHQGPLPSQHSHFAVSGSSSWPLPPPPPLLPQPPFINYSAVTSATGVRCVTSETLTRAYPPELPAHSQASDFQLHGYRMQGQELPQPSLHMDDSRSRGLSSTLSQPFGGTGLVGEPHRPRGSVQDLNPPKSFVQGNIPAQPSNFIRDAEARVMQPLLGDNLPSGGFFTSPSQNLPQVQHHWSPYDRQQPAADGLTVNPSNYGNISSNTLRYTSNLLDKNQPSYLSEFRGSRNHYNPYASTFDQPLSSKFNVSVFKQEDIPCNKVYDGSYGLSRNPVDGHGFGSLGSRHVTSSPKSEKATDLPRSGSDQYDPLFDSIEPSSNLVKKLDRGKRHETIDDPITLERSGSYKPLDVDESKKHTDVGVVTETISVKSENDEFGEMADAEVGDVENVSASNPIDAVTAAAGEIEIDQVKTPGKSKKKKDSRSMKLFKVALADFVKEVLKPSWRQGNMSKEAFKTIVKKTVDKVSGAMRGHQIPKSQTKINQYIDSQQRKLTKLVMGYVQKYCKA